MTTDHDGVKRPLYTIASDLEAMAAAEPPGFARHRLLMEAAAVLRKAQEALYNFERRHKEGPKPPLHPYTPEGSAVRALAHRR